MSNFETQNALIVQDHYQSPAVDNFDYDEPGACPIRGGNAKFDAGAFFVGKEKTLLAPERRFIVLDKAAGWVFLKAGCPAEYLMQSPGQPTPERPECGEETDWPLDLNKQPSCPWKWTRFLYLMDADSGETITFSSNTNWRQDRGRRADAADQIDENHAAGCDACNRIAVGTDADEIRKEAAAVL